MDNNLMIPEGFEVEYSPKESTNTPEGFDTESIPEGFEIEAEQAEEQMPFPDTELSASPKRTVVDGLKDAWQFVTEVPVAAFIEQNRQTEAAELRTKGIYLRKIGKDLSEEEKQRISELDKPFNSGRYNAANNYGIYSNFIKNDKGEYIAYGADVSVENTANSIKQFYADVMKQTAIMYSIGKEGGIGAVAGYVAGGALGGITTKSLAGASAGGKAGASLLARTAVAKKSFELEAGFMRQELEQVNNEIVESGAEALKENEIDNLSIGVGAINASLEMLGLKTVLSAMPKGKEILKNFEAEGVKNLVKSPSFRQAYKEFAARRALASIEEGTTEALQETVNFLASNMAKKMRDVAPTPLADKIDEILYAGLLGAVCSFAMGGVGTTAQVANVKVRQGLSKKQAQKEASEMSLDERLEFANENISTLAEIATEEADNTLNAIKAGVTYDRYKEELKRQGTTEEVADNAAQLVEQLHNVIVDKFGEEGKEQLKKSDLQIVIDKNNENQIIKEKDFIESEPEIESSLLQTFKPEELQTDAATFQYKEDSDAEGVTSRLQGVEKFDPLYSGKIIVYETKDGQKYVVDGHQRLGLAKRLNDPNIRLQGYVFKEADGYTPQDVRVMAAQKNIAEGSGTAVDTAKIIREVGVENMPASISKNSALYREGVSLARLGDEAFQKVINKEIDMGYAARVADAIRNDEAKQALAIDLIAKGVAQGRIANQEMAYGVAAQINSADTTVSEQTNLFGTEEVAQTLYIEKAQIVNRAIKNLDLTKTSLSAAVRNKGKLEKVGENKVDEASSKAVIAENKIAKAIIEKLAYTVGEISDKANELSEKLSEQEISLDEAAKEFNNFVKSPEIMKKVAGYTKKEIKTNVVIIDEALNNPPELTEEEKKAFADLEEGRKNRDKYVNEVIKMIEENNLPSHEEAYRYSDMDLGLLRIAIENAYSANDSYKKHIEKLDTEKAKKLARVKTEKKKAEIEEKFQKDGYDYAKEVLENTRKEIIRRIKRDIADFDMSEKDRKKLVKYDQEALISDEENDETFFTPLEFYQEGFYQDTAEVYLPETEYFKTWFKDSKVVDEDGKPLVMYHGTDAKFEAFDYKNFGKTDNGTRGKGFYFTDEKYQAQKYGNKLYSVYLNMQKPLRLGRNGEYATLLEFVQKKLNIPEIKNLEDYEKYGKLLLDSEDRTKLVKESGYDGIIDIPFNGAEKEYVVFEPEQIKSVDNVGTFNPNSPNIFEQSAWNGSPSKFERFSTDFIGTGEGNQAHGWGIYFAGNRDVSEGYRKRLTKAKLKIDGTDVILKGHKFVNKETLEPYFKNDLEDSYLDTFVTVLGFTNKDTKAAIKFIKNEIEKNKDSKLVTEDLENTLKFIEDKNIEYIESQGQLYEADIPETDVMLDEDKTFAEQPEKVQAAIKKMAENPFAYPFKNFVSGELKTGKDFYNELALDLGISDSLTGKGAENYDKLASEFLNKIGIEGITYDGARDGRCFVVFDDKAIRIMNTYYQFAGENSQTADQNSLSNAKSMLKKGTPAGVVREETGWFIGADGKWRYEISDDDAILDEDIARYREPEKVIDVEEYENKIKEIEKPLEEIRKEYYDENISHSEMMAESQKYWDKSAPLKEAIENYQREVRGLNVHKLGDILDHEKLYAAYPELRNLRVVFQPDNSVYYGMFSDNTLYLTQRAVDEGKIKATLMHEIQHYIQGKERFATGGNTSNIKADIEHGLIKLQRTEGGREYYNKIWKWEDLSEEEARIAKALQVAKVAENPEHLFKTGWWAKNGTMFKPKKTSKDYKAFVEEWFEKYNDSIRESLETPLDIDRHREYIEMDIKELQKLYNNTRAKEKYAYQNIMNFKTKNSELVTHIETLKKAVSELQQAYQAENDYEVGKLSLDDYKRLAGEVEARNTEARMNMTESERKANDYTKTQDVSNADQLIVFSDGSTVPFSAASMEGSQGPKKSNGPRGRFRIDENGGAIIEVLENGDASTIVHELGHYYLYSLEQLAQTNKRAEKELKDIYDYLGREIGKEYSRDDQVEFHEKFARSFEAYLMNGKAPTKKMKTAFEHFKDWLKDVYNSLKDLNVDFSEESIKLFDRIFTTDEEYEKEVLPKYEYNYNKTIEIEEAKNNPMYQLRKFVDDSKTGISTWYDKLFIPLDSRLSKISPELAMKLRKHTAALSLVQGKDFKVAEDFFKAITKIKKASEEDYYTLDLALKNRDSYTVNRLANKYDFVEEMDAVRDMLDDIRDEALEVGINVGYLENYYPREVKRDMLDKYLAFIDALKRKEDIDVSKQILSSEDAQISLILDEMKREKNSEFWTQEDIAKYINSKLRGFGRNNILLSRSGNLKKSRGIDELNGDFNQFYETMEVALINYISGARKTIEARKFFGNENAEVGKLRATIKRKKATLKEVEERTPSQAKYKEIDRVKYELAPLEVKLSSLQKQEEKEPEIQELQDRLEKKVKFLKDQVKWLENSNPFLVKGVVIKRMKGEITEAAEKIEEILGDTKHIEDSIGQLVQTLAANGDIIAKDEKAIREMLTARFAAQSISDPVRLIRDMTYIATLNDITNAITQFGDLAFSVYKYGFKNTAKSFGRPFGIKKEDLGLNDMAYEFSNPSKLSKWIKTQFKWIGLDKIDGMGKNTIIQASILNAQEKIKKNDKVFDEKLQRIFGKDSEQVKKELLRGEITDNTIIFAFHELAEIQPISEDQTPELYNNGGGFMRLFYTLKTYGIKALDIARQDVTIKIEQGIKKQDKKMVAEGLKNLIRLQMLLWLFGVPIDALKDLLSNRDINLFESFIDSLIPAFLVNRYAFRTAGKEGVGAAVVDYFTPSMASVVERLGKNYAVTNIPFIGKPLYNWGIK